MRFFAPVAASSSNGLPQFVEDALAGSGLRDAGVFKPAVLWQILDNHFARQENFDSSIWAFDVFQSLASELPCERLGAVMNVLPRRGT